LPVSSTQWTTATSLHYSDKRAIFADGLGSGTMLGFAASKLRGSARGGSLAAIMVVSLLLGQFHRGAGLFMRAGVHGGRSCVRLRRLEVRVVDARNRADGSRQKVMRFEQPDKFGAGIFPASRKARAFARAWLSADRSAGDSFPDNAPRAARLADDMLRIAAGPKGPTRFQRAQKCRRSTHRSQCLSVRLPRVAL